MMASSVPSREDDAAFADRRAHPRVSVALPAFLQAGGERHSVQILDLSAGGAKLNCPASLPAGTAVTLDCGMLARSAVVRWQNGEVLGLCFDLFTVIWQTTMQREVPPAALSRVSSYDALGSLMLGPLGLVLAGPVAEAVGPHLALTACGLVMIGTTLFALCFPEVRGLRARADAPLDLAPPGQPGPTASLP